MFPLILALLGPTMAQAEIPSTEPKPRLLILTDIGGDPDDTQSLIRLLLYSNEVDIEGLIASAAGIPGELKEDRVRPDLIRQVVEAYGKVHPNLMLHDRAFPTAQKLLQTIKSGNPKRGRANVGQGKETEGSDWIIRMVDKKDPRVLNICVWGGPTELAQALDRVKRERAPNEVQAFLRKVRVFSIGHQDDSGPGILRDFPDLFYILSMAPQGKDKRLGIYRGMYLGGEEQLTSRDWVDRNVRLNHGPLGALYPTQTWTAPNPHSCLKEGDTPSWFYFLPNQPGNPEHPEWGNWGGRFLKMEGTRHYQDAREAVDLPDPRRQVWRWRPSYQNEFQARMNWCVQPFNKANHRPVARIAGHAGDSLVEISAQPGSIVLLDPTPSTDPDNDKLTFHWENLGPAIFDNPKEESPKLRVPVPNELGWEARLLLTVKDSGFPQLVTYKTVLIRLKKHPAK